VSSTNLIRLPAADPFAPGDVTACCRAAGKFLTEDCRSFAADHGSALTSAGLPSGDGSVDTPFCVSGPAPPAPAPARSPWTLPSLMWIPTPHGPREVDLLGRGGGTPLSDGIILRGWSALPSSKSPKTGKHKSGLRMRAVRRRRVDQVRSTHSTEAHSRASKSLSVSYHHSLKHPTKTPNDAPLRRPNKQSSREWLPLDSGRS